MDNPVLVRTVRGGVPDTFHRGCFAVVEKGRVVRSAGDIERPIHLRSSAKPLQALAVVAEGAADAFGLNDKEIAVMCGSHGGEPEHVETVRSILARAGLDESRLQCGVHPPAHEASRNALIRAGAKFAEIHNNCSGKHAGMLALARHLGAPVETYRELSHPVQQAILKTLGIMADLPTGKITTGPDGCGVPSFAMPVKNMALSMARMTNPDGLPPGIGAACKRVIAAALKHPLMIGGHERFCTDLNQAAGGKLLEKAGANGVFVLGLPGRDMGVALRTDDGQNEMFTAFLIHLLRSLGILTDAEVKALDRWSTTKVLNARKEEAARMEFVEGI